MTLFSEFSEKDVSFLNVHQLRRKFFQGLPVYLAVTLCCLGSISQAVFLVQPALASSNTFSFDIFNHELPPQTRGGSTGSR